MIWAIGNAPIIGWSTASAPEGSEGIDMRPDRVFWGVWQVDRPGPVDAVDGADEGAAIASS
jgi:hypothetical protein